MALPDPRILPTALQKCTFALSHGEKAAVHHGGLRQTITLTGSPVWSADIATPQLSREDRIKWQSWWQSMRGGLVSFVTHDHDRDMPQAYPSGMPNDWDGVATVTSLPGSGVVSLAGCPADYAAKSGDRIGLVQTVSGKVRYGYFNIVEDAAATAQGVLSVTVAPFVPSLFTTAASARLLKPVCEFRVVRGSFNSVSDTSFAPVSFQAVQVL